jgi:hypothetical protein
VAVACLSLQHKCRCGLKQYFYIVSGYGLGGDWVYFPLRCLTQKRSLWTAPNTLPKLLPLKNGRNLRLIIYPSQLPKLRLRGTSPLLTQAYKLWWHPLKPSGFYMTLQDFRFSQRCSWVFGSFGVWSCFRGCAVCDVVEPYSWTAWPLRWRQNPPCKGRELHTGWHRNTHQNNRIIFFISCLQIACMGFIWWTA